MCIVTSYWHRGRQTKQALGAMAKLLNHHGPDDKTMRPKLGWGADIHCLPLSAEGIGGGYHPLVGDQRLIDMIQSGQPFNFREPATKLRVQGERLRPASNTKTIRRSYEREGTAFQCRLNDNFYIAFEDTLCLTRGHFSGNQLCALVEGGILPFVLMINVPKRCLGRVANFARILNAHLARTLSQGRLTWGALR